MPSNRTYDSLVARGCLCGTDRLADCRLHGYGDNRGIAAFFKAGMPCAFPMVATCSICGDEGLMYPNVDIDERKGTGKFKPTLICPRCSRPACEQLLRTEVEASGLHTLNGRTVFGETMMAEAA